MFKEFTNETSSLDGLAWNLEFRRAQREHQSLGTYRTTTSANFDIVTRVETIIYKVISEKSAESGGAFRSLLIFY